MVKAKVKALNILLPEDLADWFTDYAKSKGKTKTDIICSLLQGIQNGGAYSDVDKPVDNSIDGIESIIKAYLDKHLQSYIDKYLHDTKQVDVVNPVDSDKDVYVDTDVVNPVDSNVDTDVDNPVDDSDELPIIEAIASAPDVDISKGINTQKALELALARGLSFKTQPKDPAKSLRENFDSYNKKFNLGLSRIEFKNGRENWLYFDTQTPTQ